VSILAFTYRSARSGSLVAGLGLAIAVETVVLHHWLGARHPWLAWALTVGSVAALAWLAADYRAMGRGAVRLDGDTLDLCVGRRIALELSRATVLTVVRPTWRDLPAPGTPGARDYLNLMKPTTPNVLVTLAAAATVRLPGGLARRATRLGLRLDDPDAFVAALAPAPLPDPAPAT
jgi:hypothetical protein